MFCFFLFFWQVHQRNGSKSCIDGAREKKYNLISSIQFYTNQRRRYHTSHSSKHTLLTVSVHAYNYCVYPKQKQLPPSKCTFLEWNKKKWQPANAANYRYVFSFFLREQSKTFILSTTLDHLSFNIQSLIDAGGLKTYRMNEFSTVWHCLNQKSSELERMVFKIQTKVKYKK